MCLCVRAHTGRASGEKSSHYQYERNHVATVKEKRASIRRRTTKKEHSEMKKMNNRASNRHIVSHWISCNLVVMISSVLIYCWNIHEKHTKIFMIITIIRAPHRRRTVGGTMNIKKKKEKKNDRMPIRGIPFRTYSFAIVDFFERRMSTRGRSTHNHSGAIWLMRIERSAARKRQTCCVRARQTHSKRSVRKR